MKRVLTIFTVSAALSVLVADGGVFPPLDVEIYEPYQYAIIEYSSTQEVLHLTVNVNTDAGSFGWIVPLPSKPTIEEDTIEIFSQIDDMCTPSYGGGFGCMSSYDGGGYYYEDYGVRVLEEGSVGVLSYEIVQADNSDTLFNWLLAKGYPVVDTVDSTKAIEVFTDYINRDWVFVLFSVDSFPQDAANVQPVKFTFTSDQIVYPMKITLLNAKYHSENGGYYDYYDYSLLLHVIAEHRVIVQEGSNINFEYLYANKLNAREYKAVQDNYPLVAEVCKEGDFITRVGSYYYDPLEIESDIVLVYAEDDSESSSYYYTMGMAAFPLLPVAFIFGLGFRLSGLLRKKRKGK